MIAVGALAPQVRLALPFGHGLTSQDLRGTPALLVFLPLAFSPICTGELRALQGALKDLSPARVLVISCDPASALQAWRESEAVSVEVASDFWPHGSVADAFGAFDPERGWPRRRTVLLDGEGEIAWIDEVPPGHSRDVALAIAAVSRLGAGSVV